MVEDRLLKILINAKQSHTKTYVTNRRNYIPRDADFRRSCPQAQSWERRLKQVHPWLISRFHFSCNRIRNLCLFKVSSSFFCSSHLVEFICGHGVGGRPSQACFDLFDQFAQTPMRARAIQFRFTETKVFLNFASSTLSFRCSRSQVHP